MIPYWQTDNGVLYCGDVFDCLGELEDESVQCVITSPPYWGLRDYGTAIWHGGDENCDHRHQLGGEGATSAKQNTSAGTQTIQYRDQCRKCGAIRVDKQLGLEKTPEEYVERMVDVFCGIRRILRDDGTAWLNMGDSYIGGGRGGLDGCGGGSLEKGRYERGQKIGLPTGKIDGLKSKDLAGIPWRLALALQADGWYLRCDIIWSKPNPMPESVTDRPTKSHEYIFLMSKNERYYYDEGAIREDARWNRWGRQTIDKEYRGIAPIDMGMLSELRARGRNCHSVWTISTQPYRDAHFATFPEDLAKRCIFAGCPESGVVLDPFMGSGTVGLVAEKYGRKWIGIELNEKYCEIARRRISRESCQLKLV